MLTCPERRYEPSEPNLTTYMASKDEEETPCMEGVTEFHFIGADEGTKDKRFSFGEHKGKLFSEVAKEFPKYSR
eukprot:7331048-Karenia_brevis.AAC.1